MSEYKDFPEFVGASFVHDALVNGDEVWARSVLARHKVWSWQWDGFIKHAIQGGHLATLKFIGKHSFLKPKTDTETSPPESAPESTYAGAFLKHAFTICNHAPIIDHLLAIVKEKEDDKAIVSLAVGMGANAKIVTHLVKDAGYDVNACDPSDFSPLMRAAQRGDLEMAQFLVDELGADLAREGMKVLVHPRMKSNVQDFVRSRMSRIECKTVKACAATILTRVDSVRYLTEGKYKAVKPVTPLQQSIIIEHATEFIYNSDLDGLKSYLFELNLDWGKLPSTVYFALAKMAATCGSLPIIELLYNDMIPATDLGHPRNETFLTAIKHGHSSILPFLSGVEGEKFKEALLLLHDNPEVAKYLTKTEDCDAIVSKALKQSSN